MLARTGSLIETVERLRGKGRSLRPYQVEDLDGVKAWLADNKILDPEGPGEMFEPLSRRKPLLKRLRPHLRREDGGLSKQGTALAVGGALAAALVALAVSRKRD